MNQYKQVWSSLMSDVRTTSLAQFTLAKQKALTISRKEDGSFLTQTDLALQQSISKTLAKHLPNIPVLGEEMSETEQQSCLETGNCWLLDPLDGTSNFSHNIPIYTVSLALMIEGRLVAGMVFDPNRDELFSAIAGEGAQLNNHPLRRLASEFPDQLKDAMSIIDTKRLSRSLAISIVTEHPYHSQRSFGSVALDWCWLAAGRVQTYLHGKQKLWDFAAGALIAQEAGCMTTTLTGESILASPLSLQARSAVGACPAIGNRWLTWITKNS